MENSYQSMYLNTLPNNKKVVAYKKSSLDISDIVGARSRYIEHPRPQRTTNLDSFDIEKSQPRQIIPSQVNRPNYCLEVDDIQGTRTKIGKFTTTRNTNPLVPHYQVPQVVYQLPEEPKFIRDNLSIDDIQGVRSRQTFAVKLQRANKTINTKEEISRIIKPTPKGFNRTNHINDSLNVEDINQGEIQLIKLPKRQTNPLEPIYNSSGDKNYGEIKGSKANIYSKPLRVNNSLKTQDIEGSKTKINNFVSHKKEDIVGSNPQSLKRSVSSNRQTNPLQPQYKNPGWSESSGNCHFTRPQTAVQRFDKFIK